MKPTIKNKAWLRFYEELNDFLPQTRRKTPFVFFFNGNPVVKSVIEETGVPHVEVDLIIVNGTSVDFSYRLKDGDRVSVYPRFESLDISNVQKLRPKPLRTTRFVVDEHLGRLARYLRLCGFDVKFERKLADSEIAVISASEKRIVLTRDRDLLKAKIITHGYWVRESDPVEQVREVISRFDLRDSISPLSRCIECNGRLKKVSKTEIIEKLQLMTRKFYDDFWKCDGCDRIYWEGSHYDKMKEFVDLIKG